ncbi:Pycsar system effector family protein [Streptosporangium jomthongense]|uniref:Pycsar system effector family protein n=1 Tax=Streptosporangium jomthongense TaxID=1193683 RepID=A0ABV8F1M3_9ACTN
MTQNTTPNVSAYFARQADAARLELARADAKANTLLTVTGTTFSVLSALAVLAAGKLSLVGMSGIGTSVAGLGTATVVLLLVVLPTLPPRGHGVGFTVLAAYRTDRLDELLTRYTPDDIETGTVAEAVRLADIAYTKFSRIRIATRFMIAALSILAVTATALIFLS